MASPRPGRVRIIAGRWRGRRIPVPDLPELRPTPDRVRETLFNWLQGALPGTRCLDLFAGSGLLGLEALSRGAAEVVAVERSPRAADALRRAATELGATGLQVRVEEAQAYLRGTPRPFDIVFLDPPFASDLLPGLLAQLTAGWLAPAAWVYLESGTGEAVSALPPGWEAYREGRAGEVHYRLVRAPA